MTEQELADRLARHFASHPLRTPPARRTGGPAIRPLPRWRVESWHPAPGTRGGAEWGVQVWLFGRCANGYGASRPAAFLGALAALLPKTRRRWA